MAILLISRSPESARWPEEIARIDPTIEVRVWPDTGPVEDVEMILPWKAPAGELGRYPNARCIVSLGHGVDHLLASGGLPEGVPVVRLVDDSMRRQMTAYVLAAVLRHVCRFPDYARLQAEARWQPLEAADPQCFTVLVLGLGALGRDVAEKLAGLGFRVLGWSRSPKDIPGVACHAGDRAAFAPLLPQADVICCLLPLTPETRDILDARAFAAMKESVFIVNTARGLQIDEDALLAALESGRVAGACLDVFREEPLPPDHPLWRHPRVTVTPHVAAITLAWSCAPQVVENYRRLRAGKPLLNVVDLGRGY